MSGFIFYFSMIKYENYKINENVKGLMFIKFLKKNRGNKCIYDRT